MILSRLFYEIRKFLKLKMVTDPVYVKELDQDFHEESLKVMDKDWYIPNIQNELSEQTLSIKDYWSDSTVDSENENKNTVKIDSEDNVDPEKQKILNTIFRYKSKKPVIETDFIKNEYISDDDDSDIEKTVFLKSILKKKSKKRTKGNKNRVHFGYNEFFLYCKDSSIIPKPKISKQQAETYSKGEISKAKQKNLNTKKNVQFQPDEETNTFPNNNKENAELINAGQILLMKTSGNERENIAANEEMISNVDEIESINIECRKNKEKESPTVRNNKRKSSEKSDNRNKSARVITVKSETEPPSFNSQERINQAISLNNNNYNEHHKLSTEVLATLCVFENCETTQVKPLADLHKMEIERAKNLTQLFKYD